MDWRKRFVNHLYIFCVSQRAMQRLTEEDLRSRKVEEKMMDIINKERIISIIARPFTLEKGA